MLNGPARSALSRCAPVCARDTLYHGQQSTEPCAAETPASGKQVAASLAGAASPKRAQPRTPRHQPITAEKRGARRTALLGSYEALLLRGVPTDGGCPALPFAANLSVFDSVRGAAARHALSFSAAAVLPGAPWAGRVSLPARGLSVSPGGTIQLAVRPESYGAVLHVFVVRVPEVSPGRAVLVCQRKHALHAVPAGGSRRVLRAAITLRIEARGGDLLACGALRLVFALREEPLDDNARSEKFSTLSEVHDVLPSVRSRASRFNEGGTLLAGCTGDSSPSDHPRLKYVLSNGKVNSRLAHGKTAIVQGAQGQLSPSHVSDLPLSPNQPDESYGMGHECSSHGDLV